ncbi:MAG: GAF domain-containing protein [Oscillatoriales cyanobacterium C42_A2020_001]|nr:GAF domain-containing protein [Leptolyngbyaceae cyanobacterium C42_A2020_001]
MLSTPDSQDFLQAATERAELIEKLLAIGTALSSTHDLEELLSLILSKSREITFSDAGSVYLIKHDGDVPSLLFKVAQNFSKPAMSFREFGMPLTHKSLAGYVALTGETLNLPDAYELSTDVPYQLDRSFDRSIGYRTRSVLVLPMQNQKGETIGVLQLINRKISPESVITPENVLEVAQPFSEWEERIVRSLASQAAISIERTHLQESIEQLFEGFVKAAVQIIETRDPCTSGHSERVADLTVRLSQEVSDICSGSFAGVRFSDRQIQEIRYAALLHDFGKVGVPEAILVKAKKLYPLQLEVVKNRFGLVRRTLEMDCAQAKYRHLVEHPNHLLKHPDLSTVDCPHCQRLEQLDTELAEKLAELDHYWQVLLEANEPRILAEEPLMQLKEICQYTYRDADGKHKPLISMEEMEQLIVRRGNLTEAERLSIQSHVTHTYQFLRRIPWTKELQDVPAIAYGHHEKLDGSGYPRGLQASEIPIQSQIMAIADIYDALTAGDRPYKRGLHPIAALTILKQESAHNKLNPNLVQLFEQRQVFSVIGHNLVDPN